MSYSTKTIPRKGSKDINIKSLISAISFDKIKDSSDKKEEHILKNQSGSKTSRQIPNRNNEEKKPERPLITIERGSKRNNYTFYESKYSKKKNENQNSSNKRENILTRENNNEKEKGRRTRSVEYTVKNSSKNNEKNKYTITTFKHDNDINKANIDTKKDKPSSKIPFPPVKAKKYSSNTTKANSSVLKKITQISISSPDEIQIKVKEPEPNKILQTKISKDQKKPSSKSNSPNKNEEKKSSSKSNSPNKNEEKKPSSKSNSPNKKEEKKPSSKSNSPNKKEETIIRRRRPNFPKFERRISDKNIIFKKEEKEEDKTDDKNKSKEKVEKKENNDKIEKKENNDKNIKKDNNERNIKIDKNDKIRNDKKDKNENKTKKDEINKREKTFHLEKEVHVRGTRRKKSMEPARRRKSTKQFRDFSQITYIKLCEALSTAGRDDDGLTKINQDSYVLERNINGVLNFNIFGVLDGHGEFGHFASQFASRYIITRIKNHPLIKGLDNPQEIYRKLTENRYQIITNIYIDTDVQITKEKFNCEMSGTTCVLVIQLEEHLICANTGDSRAILVFSESPNDNLASSQIYNLSYDFKPELPDEKKRIEECGGTVAQIIDEGDIPCGPFRVWIKGEEYPGLAMSRSIGDMDAKKVGVIPNPQVIEYTLSYQSKYMIICSDGIWEFISNEEAMKIANKYYLRNDPLGLCQDLTNISTSNWLKEDIVVDDITAVVAFF